jgi:cytochrome P450
MARETVEIGGKRINSGDPVVSYIVSANRDEAHFDDPNRFDVTRSPNNYLSFGQGVHACLGRHLARLELTRLIPKFLARSGDLRLVRPGAQPN